VKSRDACLSLSNQAVVFEPVSFEIACGSAIGAGETILTAPAQVLEK